MLTRKQLKLITTILTLLLTALYSVQNKDTLVSSLQLASPFLTPNATSSYAVLRVVDGDTIDIQKDGAKVRVRLIGINSPESVDPRRPVECFGKQASQYASAILSGQSVTITTDPSQGTLDKYGRTLAYVFLPDGQNFNELMIRDGYAYEYTYRTPYQYQSQFRSAQQDAERAQRGLWSSTTCSGQK